MLDDNQTHDEIDNDPLGKLQKDSFKLLDVWRFKDFLENNIARKDLITDNTVPVDWFFVQGSLTIRQHRKKEKWNIMKKKS